MRQLEASEIIQGLSPEREYFVVLTVLNFGTEPPVIRYSGPAQLFMTHNGTGAVCTISVRDWPDWDFDLATDLYISPAGGLLASRGRLMLLIFTTEALA